LLLLDDQDELRSHFRLILERGVDARVVEAATSERALKLIRRRKFDLVISDITHPDGVNGLELLKRLREEEPDLPVMIVSGSLNEATAYWAEQLGACHCLEKPFAAGTLVEAVASVLGVDAHYDLC
jgi:DNA-binding NtrC family response regulator